MATWTKQELVDQAFAENGLPVEVYNVGADQMARALNRLDAMMATWYAAGIHVGYTLASSPGDSSLEAESELADVVGGSNLRSANARALVDLAVANPSFTVRQVEARLGISYGRANALISQLMELGILDVVDEKAYKRIFFAPRVIDVLAGDSGK